ncbi:hypothetical protein GCM10018954_086980 [Kutzneria kofuensis]
MYIGATTGQAAGTVSADACPTNTVVLKVRLATNVAATLMSSSSITGTRRWSHLTTHVGDCQSRVLLASPTVTSTPPRRPPIWEVAWQEVCPGAVFWAARRPPPSPAR